MGPKRQEAAMANSGPAGEAEGRWRLWLVGAAVGMLLAVAALPAYDREGAEGERLDRDNAYFPFMRAAGLLAGHRDAEALAAIRRAGAKARWDDYCYDVEEPLGRLAQATGPRGALSRTLSG